MYLYYGDHGYSTCAIWSWSLMKRQKRGGGEGVLSAQFSEMFIFSIHSYNRDLRCSKCIT